MQDWREIHEIFGERGWVSNEHKTYQQIWEELGLTYQDAHEWIKVGLEPRETEFIAWLKKENYQPQQVKNSLLSFKLLWWQKEIHPSFTEELKEEWGKRGFNYSIKEWVQKGLKPSEANLASYCRYKRLDPEKEDWNLDQTREEFLQNNWQDWTDIHKDFAKKWGGRTYQLYWEREGLTYQDAIEWTQSGWKTREFYSIAYWKSQGYTPETAKGKSHAQHWLEKNYPLEGVCQRKGKKRDKYKNYGKERKDIVELNIRNNKLNNSLLITDWPKLKGIDCSNNWLTNLAITNCPNLKGVYCTNNQITNLELSNLPVLTQLHCSANQLTNLNFLTNYWGKLTSLNIGYNKLSGDLTPFSQLVNCESLWLNVNHFTGSLKHLQKLSKLRRLDIHDTNLDSGIEYLPKSLLEIRDRNKNETVATKKEGLFRYKKERDIGNPPHDLVLWRQNQPAYQSLQQNLLKVNPNLNIQEIINQFEFFNVKTGEFQGNLQFLTSSLKTQSLLEEKLREVFFLELRIQELTHLIKTQKDKVVQAYLYFAEEKELLQELITVHLEYIKFKAKESNSDDYDEKCEEYEEQINDLKKQLRKKISKENMNKVRIILNDCEELVSQELELETKSNRQIDFSQQVVNIINVNQGNALVNCRLGDNTNLSYNNAQVGNINIENSNFAGTVVIGVGQIGTDVNLNTQIEEITEQQANIQLPPKSNLN